MTVMDWGASRAHQASHLIKSGPAPFLRTYLVDDIPPLPRIRPRYRDVMPETLQASQRTADQEGPATVRRVSRTTARVLNMLMQGDLSRLRSDLVADELGISPTTLRRRLRADGTSYQLLLDQARRHRCEAKLAERWLPGKSIAWELGYTEVNSFYRAFRRWTGQRYSSYKLSYI